MRTNIVKICIILVICKKLQNKILLKGNIIIIYQLY
jgi:hypothetical protein